MQRRIVEVLREARTTEPWPVWMTVYGLALRVYDAEAVTRAQVEAVRRACKTSEGIECYWVNLTVTTDHSVTGAAWRWIGQARLVPDPIESVLTEAWFEAPPILRQAHPQVREHLWTAPVDVPYYRLPDPQALRDATAWRLIRRPLSVERDQIIRSLNTYLTDRPFCLDDYAQPCCVCGTPTTGVTPGIHAYPDCGSHAEPAPPCFRCGRLGLAGVGIGRGFHLCTECDAGTTNALALLSTVDGGR